MFRLCILVLSLGIVQTASAQPLAEPVAQPVVSPQIQPQEAVQTQSVTSWQAEFEHARSLLLVGDFSKAAQQFSKLSRSALTPAEQRLASEMSTLCLHWEQGGYTLVTGGPSAFPQSKKDGLRSSGEIASLYLSALSYGIGSGITLGVFTNPESAAGGILPSLALAGGTAGLVYVLDSKYKLKSGVPSSISTGITLGLTHGLAWTLWNQARVSREDEWSGKTVAALIWGSATAGAILGGLVGTKMGTSPGRASIVSSTSLWSGAILGMIASSIPDGEKRDDAGMLAAALGLSGGAVLGYVVGENHRPSVARTRFLNLGGIAGGLVAGGLYLSAFETDDKALVIATSLGIASGIGAAWILTKGMEKEEENEATTLTMGLAPAPQGQGALLSAQGQF